MTDLGWNNEPPMPLEEYERRALLTFAKQFVICTLVGLGFAAFFALTGWGW